MLDLFANIFFYSIIGLFIAFAVYHSLQRRWACTKADRIIDGSLKSDASYINGIVEILRPPHFWSRQHESDLFRVKQLRKIRDGQLHEPPAPEQ